MNLADALRAEEQLCLQRLARLDSILSTLPASDVDERRHLLLRRKEWDAYRQAIKDCIRRRPASGLCWDGEQI